jgi:hypothetical protein
MAGCGFGVSGTSGSGRMHIMALERPPTVRNDHHQTVIVVWGRHSCAIDEVSSRSSLAWISWTASESMRYDAAREPFLRAFADPAS